MKKTALILGANGRFGRAAMAAFDQAGWTVTALVRPGKAKGQANVIEADASDPATLSKAATGFDVIVNALNPPYDKWATENPRLTQAVIAAARASGATVMLPGNVYNFGPDMPPVLTPETPQSATAGKGLVRMEMERTYHDADIPVIILRGGDYIEAEKTGNWFDSQITNKVHKGVFTYPADYNIEHAWAYLPDMARAAAGLCDIRQQLPKFADVPFPGYALTGEQLALEIEAAGGQTLKRKRTPWGLLGVVAMFMPVVREAVAMRYLWTTPHRLAKDPLAKLLPDYRPTPVETAMKQTLFP